MGLQVPAGKPMAGMAHQKMHGEKWSAIPTAPDKDDIKRFLRPVSTAATLNLAAAAAQAARLWKTLDPAFSARALTAAETAYAAALKNPKIAAEPKVEGGGIYGDGDTADEFYWAATELYITTGKAELQRRSRLKSRFHAPKAGVRDGGRRARLGSHGACREDEPARRAQRPRRRGDRAPCARRLLAAADRFLAFIAKRGYRVPMASDVTYIWGSNGAVMSAAVVLGTAYYLTKDAKYANARHRLHGLPARAQPAGVQLRLRLRDASRCATRTTASGRTRRIRSCPRRRPARSRAAPTRPSRIPTSASWA